MGSILATENGLLKRKLALERIFKPMLPSRHALTFSRPLGQQYVVGLGRDDFGSNLRAARHRTVRDGIFLNYFETWRPETIGRAYSLEKAYLHLHEPRTDGSDKEILALHCDPAIPSDDLLYKYKRGPHFHIQSQKPELHKAHIATCLTSLDQTCGSLDAITGAMGAMIQMIRDEILDRL